MSSDHGAPSTTADRVGRAPTGRRHDLRPVIVYGVLVLGLAIAANLYAASLGANARDLSAAPVGAQVALVAQAIIPALAALVAWTVARERPTWGFRRVPWRVLATAWVIGVLAVALPYGSGWLTGVASFSSAQLEESAGGLPALAVAALGLAPAVLGYVVLAIGEELGWSSFLAVRLLRGRGPDITAIAVGVAWAAFHLPLMLLVPGAVAPGVPLGWAVAMFTGQCVALAFPLVWLRHRTGSIWPVLVLHGAFNAVLYTVAEPATVTTAAGGWLLGEGGLFTTIGAALAVVLTAPLWRRNPTRGRATDVPTA